ncbi:MAG: hypothetical protein CMP10_13800 [Zetaproteobacteria bacterium]|nr:hypothetical protein [Pseudobdellovibrionaceae bacterium]|tara:strand:- start:331 stop:600 length:270 start_codon:yes stop_codon:yes gene_type:complete
MSLDLCFSEMRSLDFVDLLLIDHFYQGGSSAKAARELSLTRPAISHRIVKIDKKIGGMFDRKNYRPFLTDKGKDIGKRVHQAINIMMES